MTTKNILGLAALVAVASSGCVTCHYEAQPQSLRACHSSPIPVPLRQHVYLFIMNGYDVLDCAGLTKLRDTICEAGFPNVYYAQRADRDWYETEVRRICRDDPDARVVVLGLGGAAEHVVPLATGAVEDGVCVDALVLLDPVGLDELPPACVPTLVLASKKWAGSLAGVETHQLPGISHLDLPTAVPTVDAVLDRMTASAWMVGPLDGPRVPVLPLTDKPAPLPRPRELLPEDPTVPDEWDFLKNTGPAPSEPLPFPTEMALPSAESHTVPVSRTD